MELKVIEGGVRLETVNFPYGGTYVKRKVRTNLPQDLFYKFIKQTLTIEERNFIHDKGFIYEYIS